MKIELIFFSCLSFDYLENSIFVVVPRRGGQKCFSSGTDEVRGKREPSLCNESVKRHFWFFFYTTAGSKFDNRRIGACEHRRGSSAARTEFTHCNSQWILDRHSYCFYLYTAAIEDQNLTIEDLVIVKQAPSLHYAIHLG